MWRSLFLVNLQTWRLTAGNFTVKLTPSLVFFDSIWSPPRPSIYLSPPHQILKSPPSHVLNTCWKSWYILHKLVSANFIACVCYFMIADYNYTHTHTHTHKDIYIYMYIYIYVYSYSYSLRSWNNTHKLCNLPRQVFSILASTGIYKTLLNYYCNVWSDTWISNKKNNRVKMLICFKICTMSDFFLVFNLWKSSL